MSPRHVSFGFPLPQRSVFFGAITVEQMLGMARDVDADPLFDSLRVGDSLFAKPRPDSIALLGALAAATRRVTLGAGCMASIPVRDPLAFAYQWATLDLLSGVETRTSRAQALTRSRLQRGCRSGLRHRRGHGLPGPPAAAKWGRSSPPWCAVR